MWHMGLRLLAAWRMADSLGTLAASSLAHQCREVPSDPTQESEPTALLRVESSARAQPAALELVLHFAGLLLSALASGELVALLARLPHLSPSAVMPFASRLAVARI